MSIEKLEKFMSAISDLVSDLFWYNRRNDEELSSDDVHELIKNGEVTRQQVIDAFISALDESEVFPKGT